MYSFNIFSLLTLIASQIYILLGVYILSRNMKVSVNRLFFFVALTMSIWGLGEGMQRASLDAGTAFLWANYIAGIGATLHGPFLVHFWLEFSGGLARFRKKLPVFVIYVPALIFISIRLFYPALLTKGQVLEYWGYSTVGTSLYQLYILMVIFYVCLVVFLAFRKAHQSHGKIRRQAMTLGLGVFLSLGIGVVTQATRPFLNLKIPELSVISTFIFISLFAYAVNKHGLLAITTKTVAENVIATMNDYVVVADKKKNIALVNNSVLRTLGYKKSELVGKQLKVIMPADAFPMDYGKLMKRLPLMDYQAKLTSKSGEKISVSVNVSALKEDETEKPGLVFVMRDVREINKLISSLEQKKQELENKNDELERFNKMAVGRELKMVELKKKIKELGDELQGK